MESQHREALPRDQAQSSDPPYGGSQPSHPQPGDTEQTGPSVWSHLLGVLFSPSKTFEQLAAKPSWLLPVILAMLTSIAATAVVMPLIDWGEVLRAQMEASGRTFPEEQMEQQLGFVKTFAVGFAWAAAVLGPFIIYPVLALVFWLTFKVLGSGMSFKQSLSALLHAYAPLWLVSAVLTIPVVWSLGEVTMEQLQSSNYLMSNLSFLATEETHAAVRALLVSADLFSLWTVVLLIIGYRITARVSSSQATIAVVFWWLIYVLGKSGIAMLGS